MSAERKIQNDLINGMVSERIDERLIPVRKQRPLTYFCHVERCLLMLTLNLP
jgi:hypothetical protein